MKKGLLYCLIIPFLFACRPQKKSKRVQSNFPPFQLQLANWGRFNDYDWNNMSFPMWFSPKMIDSLGLSTLKLVYTNYVSADSLSNESDTLPVKIIDFSFRKNGDIRRAVIHNFNDGLNIVEQTITYPNKLDSFGFSPPSMASVRKYDDHRTLPIFATVQSLRQFQRLVLSERDSSFISYIDENSKEKTLHIFILDSTNWDVSFIDNHFQTTTNKVFYYGAPITFHVAFTLKNMVEKTVLESQSFYPTNTLKCQTFYREGFLTKRDFTYDSLGMCTGYTDSLQTGLGKFLRVEYAKIEYRNNQEPVALRIYENSDSSSLIRSIKFDYKTKEK